VYRLLIKPFYKVLILLSLLILTGCAVAKQPIFLSSTFGQEKIERIHVLPVVDLRFNKEPELPKLDEWILDEVKDRLERKEYTFTIVSDTSFVDNITEEDLQAVDAEWVKNLGPSGSRWVMLIALLDAKSKLTFGSTGNAEVSGYLFDKKNGSIVWRDKGIGKVGQGGLLGMVLKGMMIRDAIRKATSDLMNGFPKNEI